MEDVKKGGGRCGVLCNVMEWRRMLIITILQNNTMSNKIYICSL